MTKIFLILEKGLELDESNLRRIFLKGYQKALTTKIKTIFFYYDKNVVYAYYKSIS